LTQQPVRISRLERLSRIGCRYACDDDIRVLSADELIWNQPAPLHTVEPSLYRLVGSPASAAASSSATPHGSAGGTVRMLTGPERP
jgi:hypothetical protein